jgi:predicted nucleic acid-binding protein
MILVDTSVWVDHLRAGDQALAALLNSEMVLVHPFIIGELALGNLRQRSQILKELANLPQIGIATDAEVVKFIERNALYGRGIGYIDVHLLAAVRLSAGTALWTRDQRLHSVAHQLGLAMLTASR